MRKIDLPLTAGMGIFCLIFQNPSVLAEPSQPTDLNSEQVITAETISTADPIAPESEISGIEAVEPIPSPSPLLVQIPPEDILQEASEPMVTLEDQVTSVTQLTDVQPSDWAFEALQSLVERYGAIAGYPDSTFRGNRAMTRYEFAAALNAALDRINELIRTGLGDRVSRDDLVTLQRLQQEFATELATLRGRVDGLEARTAELEATQFSTTTKLTGQVIFAVNGGGFDGMMMLAPEQRGKGLGSEFYRAFERWVSNQGVPRISLSVIEANVSGFQFWKKMGFEVIRKTPPRQFGTKTHELYVLTHAVDGVGEQSKALTR